MTDNIRLALVDIADQLKEQLIFYREIGIEILGGSLPTKSVKSLPQPEARVRAAPELDSSSDAAGPTDSPVSLGTSGEFKQAALFAEIGDPQAPNRSRLPVIENRDSSLEAIRQDIGDCVRCKLHHQRANIVFGEGNPHAQLVFVGEAPGADEDASGRPFVGRAGQLLDKIIAAINLRREDVYIANIVKCRPPANRVPERDEVSSCEPFLIRQLALVSPRVIVALGSPAFQCLLKTRESITRVRGQWREWNGIKVMPTFHPAYLLRSPDKKREVWEDMKKVREYLNSLVD